MSQKKPFPNPDRKQLLMTLLKVMGGQTVEVAFSGGGDSGCIESVSLLDSEGKEISLDNAEFEWERDVSMRNRETNEWLERTEVTTMPLRDILERICEDCLETTDLDWYNNEGGQGSLEIDLRTDPPNINLNVEINYTHTDTHAFDFTEDGEEEDAPASSQSN